MKVSLFCRFSIFSYYGGNSLRVCKVFRGCCRPSFSSALAFLRCFYKTVSSDSPLYSFGGICFGCFTSSVPKLANKSSGRDCASIPFFAPWNAEFMMESSFFSFNHSRSFDLFFSVCMSYCQWSVCFSSIKYVISSCLDLLNQLRI